MKKKLPKISVITPSYNQAKFIETTINSVLDQNYKNLEYIVIDGKSTDGTIEILQKYKNQLIWISEKDNGQSEAINKGLKRATGEIVSYINSDDCLIPGVLDNIAAFFSYHRQALWLTGKCIVINEHGSEARQFSTAYKNFFLEHLRFLSVFFVVQFISQPATFWRRKIVGEIGYFDESLHYDMDYDYWLRIWKRYPLFFLNQNIALYRVHEKSKAVISPERQFRVEYEIAKRYTQSKLLLFLHKYHSQLALLIYRKFWIK